ncbi:hypothetical protein HY450_00065 [Candidatus Pacearchaeota archaeon]|nr:hypothetical protein [Candidatus Pacearchaeota archaeon]
MVGKKGFLKILEATIAVVIIFGALILLSSQKTHSQEEDLSEMIPPLLEEVAQNIPLRTRIIEEYDTQKSYEEQPNAGIIQSIEDFIRPKIRNPELELSARVCELDEICFLEPYPVEENKNLFSAERVISTIVIEEEFSPKKVKIFLYRKN